MQAGRGGVVRESHAEAGWAAQGTVPARPVSQGPVLGDTPSPSRGPCLLPRSARPGQRRFQPCGPGAVWAPGRGDASRPGLPSPCGGRSPVRPPPFALRRAFPIVNCAKCYLVAN